jgi:muramoyltetrapeptide carboxypeptidase
MKVIFPKSLKKGDKIAIISPAGFVEEAPLQSTLNLIKSKVTNLFLENIL